MMRLRQAWRRRLRCVAINVVRMGATFSPQCTSPRQFTHNGGVERAQSTCRYELNAAYDFAYRIDKLQSFVDALAHRLDRHRPHGALGGKIPAKDAQAPRPSRPSADSYVLSLERVLTAAG